MITSIVSNTLPERLPNGAKILKIVFDFVSNNGVVLAELDKANHDEFATWEFYNGDLSTTSNGHYFGSLSESYYHSLVDAVADFNKRS